MTTKTISIMDDVYSLLIRRKNRTESFSDVIRRVFGGRRNIMEFAGVWKNVSDKETEEMKDNIKKLKKKATKELMENDMYRL